MGIVLMQLHCAVVFAECQAGRFLHAIGDSFCKGIGKVYYQLGAAIVGRHLVECGSVLCNERFQVLGIGPPELINVLVIIAHGYHAHLFVFLHQSRQQTEIVLTHILCLIYHQYAFGYLRYLNFPILYHFRGLPHNVLCFAQTSLFSQQVEAVRVECLNLHKMCGIAYKFNQSFFEFGGCRPRECEHQQLLVFHIFEQEQ